MSKQYNANLAEDDAPSTSSDEEFDPTGQAEQDTSASSDSDSDDPSAAKRHKRSTKKRKGVDELELDSGDEATIEERAKKRRKKAKATGKGKASAHGNEQDYVSSDSDAQGGLIKTRSQRRVETKERRPLATLLGARGNVDSIWARMNTPRREDEPPGSILQDEEEKPKADAHGNGEGVGKGTSVNDDFVLIKRTYEFAGEVKTEERRVPKHSEEARVYLASQTAKGKSNGAETNADEAGDGKENGKPATRRPPRRVSRFEANPNGYVKTLPDKLQLRWPRTTDEDGNRLAGVNLPERAAAPVGPVKHVKVKAADKFTTVDKSRMDWAGFVDKEGIADDLDKYGKAKENFVERNQLLARLDERRDEQGRQARIRNQPSNVYTAA